MAINKKLITFSSQSIFEGANGLGSSNPTLNNGYYGNIPEYSIVFIQDKGKIWHKGKYYNSVQDQITGNNGLVLKVGGTVASQNISFWGNTIVDSNGQVNSLTGKITIGNTTIYDNGSIKYGTGSNPTSIFTFNANGVTVGVPATLSSTLNIVGKLTGNEISGTTISGTKLKNTPVLFDSTKSLLTTWSIIKQFGSSASTFVNTPPAAINIAAPSDDNSKNWQPWIAGGDTNSSTSWGLGVARGGDFYIGVVTSAETQNKLTHYLKFTSTGDLYVGDTKVSLEGHTHAVPSHSHGDINNNGCITSAVVTVASNATAANADFILISDSSAGGKIQRGIQFTGAAGAFLKSDGTWGVPSGDNTWKAANTSQEGYVPKLVTGGGAISAQSTEYVLTYVSSGTGTIYPVWKQLPANAFKNDNDNTWRPVYLDNVSKLSSTDGTSLYLDSGTALSIVYSSDGHFKFNVSLGTTSITAAAGNHTHSDLYGNVSSGAVPTAALAAGQLHYYYNVNNGLTGNMPASNNANSILLLNRHNGDYHSFLGFSSDGRIYYKTSLANTASWNKIAWESDIPSSLKNPSSITIQLNSGTTEETNKFIYDGSSAKTINITPASIGAQVAGDYLPLSGGNITGTITYNNGGSWISARDHCAVKTTRTSGEGSDWHPVVGIKTSAGFWSFGSVGGENLAFSHDTDSDYIAGRNTNTRIDMPLKAGTIALTSDIPTSTSQISEGTNLYFTNARATAACDGRYLRWNGSAADVTAMTWGTLTAANGYAILSHASSSDGGDMGFCYKGGQIFMQLDGYFYQNEGAYRCLDTSDLNHSNIVTALGYTPWRIYGGTGAVDINSLSGNGSYYISGAATNIPSGHSNAQLICSHINDTYGQISIPYSSSASLIWRGGTSINTAWRTVIDSQNYTSYCATSTQGSHADTAYGWGNHANAGYLTGITSSMVTTALGYTPANNVGVITFSDSGSYVAANFNNSTLSVRAAQTYIECWDGAGGWWNWKAGKWITVGGTSSHFVKGDGSLDGNTYLTGITKAMVDAVGANADTLDGQHGSYYAAASSLGNYLPLSGGRMTGDITFRTESSNWNFGHTESKVRLLKSGNTAATGAPGAYYGGLSAISSYCGFQLVTYGGSTKNLLFRKISDSDTWSQWNEIYHSGNCNNPSTPWSASSLTIGSTTSTNPYIILNGTYGGVTDKYWIQSYQGILLIGPDSKPRTINIDRDGNVGIGTSSPSYKCHIAGSAYADSLTLNGAITGVTSINGSGGIYINSDSWCPLQITRGAGGTSSIGGIDGSGVYFAHTQNSITTYMYLKAGTGLTVYSNIVATGEVTAGGFYQSSDIRLKTNITPISETIRSFNWKDSGKKSYGLIAQEIEGRYPELVENKEDGYKTVNYTAALCMIIAKLENRIKILEEKLSKN